MWDAQAWDGLDRRDARPHVRCPSYKLPAHGVIQIAPGNIITLAADAVFQPQCLNAQPGAASGIMSVVEDRDPFRASITPQAYATGAATVISWMLVIMLIITPRTFFVGNASGRSGLLGRRGVISGASGGGSVIGVGSRPWLQKVAALTVAISLTLATADTFRIAGRQYEAGFIDAVELLDEVVAGMEIKVSRVISDIFLWLAQVQTLIRLFPRHKEKVIIKWVGFALILLDITFSSLNSFGDYEDRPAHFDTAIPALSYLFELALSLLYAAWVIYYAITKRRYSFYHPMMWNMTVVALLSFLAIFTPVVFFITDIANDSIAGWGDYFRWVGAAAASVIVWEWVERIEALEREEGKGGILGREIYDGDNMLDTTPSSDSTRPSQRQSEASKNRKEKGGGGARVSFGAFTPGLGHNGRFGDLAQRLGRKMTEAPRTEAHKTRSIHIPAPAPALRRSDSATCGDRNSRTYMRVQDPPPVPVISSPVSRTDTTSVDSTVYTIRYHPVSETPPTHPPGAEEDRLRNSEAKPQTLQKLEIPSQPVKVEDPEKGGQIEAGTIANRSKWQWKAVTNPFRRKGYTPPQELQRGRVIEPLGVEDVAANIPPRNYNGLALADRLGTFAAQQGEKFRLKKKSGSHIEVDLPVTIIPAQPRSQTWSPDTIYQQHQAQQNEATAATGIQLAWMPTAVVEEQDVHSPIQSRETTNSSEVVHTSSTPNSNHSSRIRFDPEASRQKIAREQGGEQYHRSPVSGIIGIEVRGPPAGRLSPLQDDFTAATGFSIPRRQTPSNHDR